MSPDLKVNEIFWSAQGEGLFAGSSSVFIRLSGCSLGCSYCDTKEAWESGYYLTEDEIVSSVGKLVSEYPESRIVITGGEPLEQEIEGLVKKLNHLKYKMAVETNGLHYRQMDLDWWTVSPKDRADFLIRKELWDYISEIKLIVNTNLKLETVKRIAGRKKDIPVFLQPQHPDADRYSATFGLYGACIREGLSNVRLGFQMHRLYSIR